MYGTISQSSPLKSLDLSASTAKRFLFQKHSFLFIVSKQKLIFLGKDLQISVFDDQTSVPIITDDLLLQNLQENTKKETKK